MQTEYAATTRTKSSSSIWGLLFLAWMLSDNAHKSDADMRALHAEVASLRQSMTAEELRYAQDISVQEGWYLPEDSIVEPGEGDTPVQEFADVPPPTVAQEGSSRPIEGLAGPVHELLGTDDPVEAVFKMAGYMAPLMFLFILVTVMRNAFRG